MPMQIDDALRRSPRGTINEALAFARDQGARRPEEVRAYLEEVFRLAPRLGFDPAIVVAQSAEETGNWSSDWWALRLNPAGIGITGDPTDDRASSNWASGTDAARGQLVHLFVYAVGQIPADHELAQFRDLDPRYDAVIARGWEGTVRTIRDLTGKWAEDPNYHHAVAARGNTIFDLSASGDPRPGGRNEVNPIIYDLRDDADAGRFGLSRGDRDTLLGRCYPNRRINGTQGEPSFIVLHIQDGRTAGSLDHWLHGRDDNGNPVRASSTVLVNRDGSILRCIAEENGPWTNGDVRNPNQRSAALRALGDPNLWTLSIETEGISYAPNACGWGAYEFPEVQLAAVAWQVDEWMRRYDIPREHILGHSDLNSVTRAGCPGDHLYQEVLSRIGNGWAPRHPVLPLDGKDKTINGHVFHAVPHGHTTVHAARAGWPCREWADNAARPTRKPLKKGETVTVAYWVAGDLVEGDDRWWVTPAGSPISVAGTIEKPPR